MKKVIVRNEFQKNVLEHEMIGQISDGYWENNSEVSDWKNLSDAEIEIGDEIKTVNFRLYKVYDFVNINLLKVILPRVVLIYRMTKLGCDRDFIGFMTTYFDECICFRDEKENEKAYKEFKSNGLKLNIVKRYEGRVKRATENEYDKEVIEKLNKYLRRNNFKDIKEFEKKINEIDVKYSDIKKELEDLKKICKNYEYRN